MMKTLVSNGGCYLKYQKSEFIAFIYCMFFFNKTIFFPAALSNVSIGELLNDVEIYKMKSNAV